MLRLVPILSLQDRPRVFSSLLNVKKRMPNLNSDDDTEESSSDDEPAISDAIPVEEEEVVILTATAMPKKRRGHNWTRRKTHVVAPPPQPKRQKTPVPTVQEDDESSSSGNDDDFSVKRQSSWAKRTSELFEDESVRTWFLSLSREEQALVPLPQRRRRRSDILNIGGVRGQFLQEGSHALVVTSLKTEASDDCVIVEDYEASPVKAPRKKTIIKIDDEKDEPVPVSKPAAASKPAPEAPKPEPKAPAANASWRRPQPTPVPAPKAPAANASWRRPQPTPEPAASRHPTPPAPAPKVPSIKPPCPPPKPMPPPMALPPMQLPQVGPPRCRPTILSEPPPANQRPKLDLPDFCLLRAAQIQSSDGTNVPRSVLMFGTDDPQEHQWPMADAPEHPRVVDQNVLQRMLDDLKPASYSTNMSFRWQTLPANDGRVNPPIYSRPSSHHHDSYHRSGSGPPRVTKFSPRL
jgi:hypothetical protein